jgi:hypothetical protein
VLTDKTIARVILSPFFCGAQSYSIDVFSPPAVVKEEGEKEKEREKKRGHYKY